MNTFRKRVTFLYLWTLAGVFLSFVPIVFQPSSSLELAAVSAVFGTYFGLGMPATMGFFAASTSIENRSQLAGITFLTVGMAFSVIGIAATDVAIVGAALAAIRIMGLLFLFLLKFGSLTLQEHSRASYISIVTNKSFMLYFVPWCMFSLVNYMTIPLMGKFFSEGEDFIRFSSILENILVAIFTVVAGFLASMYGRKRLTIIGFALLGIGYAVLGLTPHSIETWSFYIAVDGIAWGIFYTMFLFTLWGDLAEMRNAEKFYVIGALPYLFSNFMRVLFGTIISSIPSTAIFSFASVFLFLAVLPLIYAPETVPEKTLKDRDLKSYADKAIKKAQKETERKHKPNLPPNEEETEERQPERSPEDEEARRLAEKYY
ncbi:MAG: hypothetical protein ACE14S_00965 [Candidatus Bathyarchaeia archaeon]